MGKNKLYYVEKIMGHTFLNNVKLYEIKWKGYSYLENTFEPI